MLHFGKVSEVNAASGRVRVTLEELDNLPTDWLQVVYMGTKNDKAFWLPDIGEHVACLLDENAEAGVVIGAVYSEESAPPAALAAPGARVLQVFRDGVSVFLASVRRARNGAVRIWAKGAIAAETEASLTLAAGTFAELGTAAGKVKISQSGRVSHSANGGNLHTLLKNIAQLLATHKHVVAGPTTTVLSPDDILKAANIALEIEKILEP